MEILKIIGVLEIVIFMLLIYGFIKMIKKENKLCRAIDHFTKNSEGEDKEKIADVIKFEQNYSKDLKLFKAMENNKDYYKEEVAKVLALELIKNGAVKIEFIQGVEEDTIKGSVNYFTEV
jgi:hypothetical protein